MAGLKVVGNIFGQQEDDLPTAESGGGLKVVGNIFDEGGDTATALAEPLTSGPAEPFMVGGQDFSQPATQFLAGDNPLVAPPDWDEINAKVEADIAQRRAEEANRNTYLANLKRGADWEQEMRGPITGSSPYRIVESGLRSAADAIVNPLLAVEEKLGFEHAGDMLSARQARADMEALRDKSWIERQIGGIVDSVAQSATLAGTGGLPAVLGGIGYQSYSDSYRDAKISGATDDEASKIARANAAFEVGVTSIFQLAGVGGVEKALLNGTRGQGAKEFIKQMAAEVGEEEITGIGQSLASTAEMPSAEDYFDTAIQAAGGYALVTGVQKVGDFVAKPSVETAREAGLSEAVVENDEQAEQVAEGFKKKANQIEQEKEDGQQAVEPEQPIETEPLQIVEPAPPDAPSSPGQVEQSPEAGGPGLPPSGQGTQPLAEPAVEPGRDPGDGISAIPSERDRAAAVRPVLTGDEFKSQIKSLVQEGDANNAPITSEQADALVQIVEARARAMGETLDEYVGKRITNVERAPWQEMAPYRGGERSASDVTQLESAVQRELGQPAYHGSPHKFDKFTLDAIGTGEGAQAYGWGLYFAGDEAVARFYKEKLSDGYMPSDEALSEYFKPGRIIPGYGGEADRVISYKPPGKDGGWRVTVQRLEKDAAGNWVDKFGEEPRTHFTGPTRKELIAAGVDPGVGRLYKVDLKPTDEELLDWDKPLSEQGEVVGRFVNNLPPKLQEMLSNVMDSKQDGKQLYTSLESILMTLREHDPAWEQHTSGTRIDKIVSEMLHESGIRGIKYKDAGSRGKDGGTHNYVIFDNADVVIEDILAQKNSPRGWESASAKNENPDTRSAEIVFFRNDGRAVIRAFEQANVSSLAHELGHLFRRDLSGEDLLATERWAGVKDGQWTREAEEKFARGFERFLAGGKVSNQALKRVFEKFKQWIKEVYGAIRGSAINVRIPPEMEAVYDRMFLDPEAQEASSAQPKKRSTVKTPRQKQMDSFARNGIIGETTINRLNGMDDDQFNMVIKEAQSRSDAENEHARQLISDYENVVSKYAAQASRAKRLSAGDYDKIKNFDQVVDLLSSGPYETLRSLAEARGNGDVSAGLFDILQEGKKQFIQATVDEYVDDILEEMDSEAAKEVKPATSSGNFDFEDGGEFRSSGPEEEFTLKNDPGRRVAGRFDNAINDKQKGLLGERDDLEGQQEMFGGEEEGDASFDPSTFDDEPDLGLAGSRSGRSGGFGGGGLKPAPQPLHRLTPKSQRQIIAEMAKGIKTPIRFGRLRTNRFAGYFLKLQNLIGSKKANDVPTVSHEVGHRLDSIFKFSSNKSIAKELDYLGDPSTPNSRSSWTKSKSKMYKRGEGAAEFVRYWLTDPTHAAQVAPNMHVVFEQALDNNKDLGDTMRQAQDDIRVWQTSEPQARLRSHISIGENPNKTRYSLSQLTRDVVDDLHALNLFTKDAKKNSTIPASKDPYLLARNLRGSYGMAETFINKGAVDFNSKGVDLGTSLEDALKPISGRLNDFRDWIVAKRAQELHSQGRQTGLLDDDVNAVFNKFSNDPDFNKAFDDIKRWNDAILQYAVDAGLVTEDSAEAMRAMNQDYVPFHRVFEIGAGESPSQASQGMGSGLNVGKPGSMKRLKGSTRDIVDPLETMVRNAYVIVTAAEKAAINTAVAEMASKPDMGRWIEEIKAPQERVGFGLEQVRDQLENAGADLDQVDDDLLLSFFRPSGQAPFGENVIRVLKNGQEKFYRVNKDLNDAFHALDQEQSNTLTKALAAPAQLLRAGVTLDPAFSLFNAVRDTVGAAVLNRYGAFPFETTIRGMAAMIGNPQLVAEWQASGGSSAIEAAYFDREKMQKHLEKNIAKNLTAREKALVVSNPLRALRLIAQAFEESTRIGEYQIAYNKLRGQGVPEGDARRIAAFEARDRQDFSKGGAKTKALRHIAPFWNASLQSNVKIAQAFRDRPVKTTLQGMAFITGPTLALMAINWDDEDYWDRPQWERDAFWLIPVGDDENGHTEFLRLPKAFALGAIFGTLPERILQSHKEGNTKAAGSFPGDFAKEQGMSMLPASTSLTLAYELTAGDQGWSYFRDRPVVPDSMVDLPPELQYTEQTGLLAKKIGQALGVSPMKVDHLLEQTTGGLGKLAMLKQSPTRRFFTTDLNVSNQTTQEFYDLRQQLREEKSRFDVLGEDEGMSLVMLDQIEKASEKIAEMRTQAQGTEDEAEKSKLLEESYQLAKSTLERYRENPQPDEAVKGYADRRVKYAVMSLYRPEKTDKETDQAFARRIATWEKKRQSYDSWLKNHTDHPQVRSAIKEAVKNKNIPRTGKDRQWLRERRKIWGDWKRLSSEWN